MLLGKHRKGEDIREMDQGGEGETQEEDYEPIKLLLPNKERSHRKSESCLSQKYTRFESMQENQDSIRGMRILRGIGPFFFYSAYCTALVSGNS